MSTNTNTTAKYRTISLTNHAPVRINEANWPMVASGTWSHNNDRNGYEFQASRKWAAGIFVRRHADGRAIVYGYYEYVTAYAGESDDVYKAGILATPDDDLPNRINEVAAQIIERMDGDHSEHISDVQGCAANCINDLPAVDLD